MKTYRVWSPTFAQEPEDGKKVIASDPRDAARTWAKWFDASSTEYYLAKGNVAAVLVKEIGSPLPPSGWTVTGEAIPSYTATRQS